MIEDEPIQFPEVCGGDMRNDIEHETAHCEVDGTELYVYAQKNHLMIADTGDDIIPIHNYRCTQSINTDTGGKWVHCMGENDEMVELDMGSASLREMDRYR